MGISLIYQWLLCKLIPACIQCSVKRGLPAQEWSHAITTSSWPVFLKPFSFAAHSHCARLFICTPNQEVSQQKCQYICYAKKPPHMLLLWEGFADINGLPYLICLCCMTVLEAFPNFPQSIFHPLYPEGLSSMPSCRNVTRAPGQTGRHRHSRKTVFYYLILHFWLPQFTFCAPQQGAEVTTIYNALFSQAQLCPGKWHVHLLEMVFHSHFFFLTQAGSCKFIPLLQLIPFSASVWLHCYCLYCEFKLWAPWANTTSSWNLSGAMHSFGSYH